MREIICMLPVTGESSSHPIPIFVVEVQELIVGRDFIRRRELRNLHSMLLILSFAKIGLYCLLICIAQGPTFFIFVVQLDSSPKVFFGHRIHIDSEGSARPAQFLVRRSVFSLSASPTTAVARKQCRFGLTTPPVS